MPLAVHERDILGRRRTGVDAHHAGTLERFARQDPDALRPLRMTSAGIVVHVAAVEYDSGGHLLGSPAHGIRPVRASRGLDPPGSLSVGRKFDTPCPLL